MSLLFLLLLFSPEQGVRLKAEADQAFREGDYPRALQKLRAAWEADPNPAFLANQALVLERLGAYQKAVDMLEAYLKSKPEEQKRKKALEILHKLRPNITVITEPPGARLRFKDRWEELGETPVTLQMVVGEYELVLEHSKAEPLEIKVKVERDQDQRIQRRMTLDKINRAQLPPKPRPASLSPWIKISLGVAVLATSTALIFYLLSDHEAQQATKTEEPTLREQHLSAEESWNRATWNSAGLGATAALTGFGLWLLKDGDEEAVTGGLGLRWCF